MQYITLQLGLTVARKRGYLILGVSTNVSDDVACLVYNLNVRA